MSHRAMRIAALAMVAGCASSASAQLIINEIYVNPPGSGTIDDANEYIELYGCPGMDLTGYAVGLAKGGFDVNGDDVPDGSTGDNIPEVDEAFALDGWSVGSNGFFVIVNTDTTAGSPGLSDIDDWSEGELIDNPAWNPGLPESPANKRWLNGASFQALHIPAPDTVGKLSNDGSSTLMLVRRRPDHSIVAGASVYGPNYAFHKETVVDVNYDGKTDFGTETALPILAANLPQQFDPYQMVDDVAWSHMGGKEYVRSSEQEVADTPGFNPDGLSRIRWYLANPMRGHRTVGDSGGPFEIRETRMADEEWIYGEQYGILGDPNEYEYNTTDVQVGTLFKQFKSPTDRTATPYDGTCDPEPDDTLAGVVCAPNAAGSFYFTDMNVTDFRMTPGGYNDHPTNANIRQFRFDFAGANAQPGDQFFPTGDFNFDGIVNACDIVLIQARLGATLDDTQPAVYDNGTPKDLGDDLNYNEYVFQGRTFQQLLMMLKMNGTDGAGGANNSAVTASDVAAAESLICPGDVDGSQTCDLGDLNIVLFNFGSSGAPGANGDVNCDGQTDLADLNIVLFNFGTTCS